MVKQIPTATFPGKNAEPQTTTPLVDQRLRITPEWRRWTEFVDITIRRFAGLFTFLKLEDTPDSYSGQTGKSVRVNVGEDALEFYTPTTGTGDFSGPASSTANDFVQFADITGKLGKDGGLSLDIDGTLAANSDSKIPSQKAVKTYVTAHAGTGDVVGPGSATDGDFAQFDTTTGKKIKDGGLSRDTDGTLAANSDTRIPSQKAVKTYADAGDAATLVSAKAYADAIAQGLSIRDSCRLATAAALPTNVYSNGASGVGATLTAVSTGVLTVDGVTAALNDRIMVKNEVAGANNGIYKVTTAGAIGILYVLTRATDYDQAADIFEGTFAFIEEGTANAAAGYVMTTSGAITVGTTALSFTQFSSANGGINQLTGDVTAGPGTGGQIATIPNNTVTYAKMQDVSATARVIGRKTAGTGDPEECTLSDILDFIGSAAQGDILYRGASSWVRLGAGTSGQFLKTQGAAANPAWDTPSGGTGGAGIDLFNQSLIGGL